VEHRCGQRVLRQGYVRLICPDGSALIARCRDLSASGIFIATSWKPALSSPVKLTLGARAARFRTPIARLAHVVRITAEGIGLEWEDFSPDVLAMDASEPIARFRGRSGSRRAD